MKTRFYNILILVLICFSAFSQSPNDGIVPPVGGKTKLQLSEQARESKQSYQVLMTNGNKKVVYWDTAHIKELLNLGKVDSIARSGDTTKFYDRNGVLVGFVLANTTTNTDIKHLFSIVGDSIRIDSFNNVLGVIVGTPQYIDNVINKENYGGFINTVAFGDLYTPVQYITNTTPSIGDTAFLSYKLQPNNLSPTQAGAYTEVVDFDSLTSAYLDPQYDKYQKFGISHSWEAGLFGNPSGNLQTSIGIENWGNTKRANLKAIWEYGYQLGDKLHTEWHLEAKDTLGRSYRPITSIQPYDGSFSDVRFTADFSGFEKSPSYGGGAWQDLNFVTGVEYYNYDKQMAITTPSTSSILSKQSNLSAGSLEILKLNADDRLSVGNYHGIKVRNSIYMQDEAPEQYPTFYSSNNIFNFEGALFQNLQAGQDQVNYLTTNNSNPLEIRYNGNIYKYRVPGLRELLSIDKNNGRVGVNMDNPTECLNVMGEANSLFNRKNIVLGGLSAIGETSWGCNAWTLIGRNLLASGSCNNLEYNKTGLGAQAIIFKDNSIDFEVQNGGGTTGGSYTQAPKVQIFGDGKVKISSLPVFADDAAAGSGGLTTGYLYQTSSGDLKIKL